MAKTIIQTIGPLYGEVVNGTVFGRPNGSIYVPAVNTISITIAASNQYVKLYEFGQFGNRYRVCNSAGDAYGTFKLVAESQDVQSYIETYLEDSNGVMVGSSRVNPAGQFNIIATLIGDETEDAPALVNGDTYNLVAVLCSASGVPVATAKEPLVAVVVE